VARDLAKARQELEQRQFDMERLVSETANLQTEVEQREVDKHPWRKRFKPLLEGTQLRSLVLGYFKGTSPMLAIVPCVHDPSHHCALLRHGSVGSTCVAGDETRASRYEEEVDLPSSQWLP